MINRSKPVTSNLTSREEFDRLPSMLIEMIKNNDLNAIKQCLRMFNIKNITWVKCTDDAWLSSILSKDCEALSSNSSKVLSYRD